MKKFEMNLVISISCFIIGAILVAWAMQALEPMMIQQVGTYVQASLDITFVYLLGAGAGFVGMGIGSIAYAGQIYLLEKELSKA